MKRLVAALLFVLLIGSIVYADIDTENRRRSVLSTRRIKRAIPVPDGSIGDGDRVQLAFSYRGFWDTPSSTGTSNTAPAGALLILEDE